MKNRVHIEPAGLGAEERQTSAEGSGAFTPGPWYVKASVVSNNLCIYSSAITDDIGGYGIGEAWNLNGRPENAANARLIAAAPDLYEALRAAQDAVEGHFDDNCDVCREAIDMIRAALSKAEGRS